MSKLYNKSGILGCKSPQKAGNSPQKGGKMVLPAQECENLENSTYGTHLAAPFAAPAQCAAGVKTGNGAVEQCAAVENLDTAAHAQSVAGGKFANGVELGVAERCYVAGDETNSILSGSSVKTQQIFANTHKCFVQKANNNTNKACRTAKKQVAGGDFCYGSARKSRAHACDKLAGNNCGNTLVRARSLSGKSGNGTVEQSVAGVKSAKKHSKVLRAVACGCLAILMCGTAFLGTACSGSAGGEAPAGVNSGNSATFGTGVNASANAGQGSAAGAEQNFATQSGGLITPRADDPVLFETKDGLEIKFGQSLPEHYHQSLSGGNLAGFPYFTTNDGTTDYVWVIIGKSPTISSMLTVPALLSDEANNLDNFETATPAGSAITADGTGANMVQQSKALFSFNNLTANSEIPTDCVLVLSNGAVQTNAYYANAATTGNSGVQYAVYFSTFPGAYHLHNTMTSYYNNASFGLSAIKPFIRQTTLYTHEYYSQTTGDATWYNTSSSAYIFPLGCNVNGNNFKWSTYLTANQIKLPSSNRYWLRGTDSSGSVRVSGYTYYNAKVLTANGEEDVNVYMPNRSDVRPAFVMSLA